MTNFRGKNKTPSRNSRKGFTFILVVPSGFEPEQAEPKSAVLPLHHGTGKSAGKCIKKIYPKKYIVQEWLVPTGITASGS